MIYLCCAVCSIKKDKAVSKGPKVSSAEKPSYQELSVILILTVILIKWKAQVMLRC